MLLNLSLVTWLSLLVSACSNSDSEAPAETASILVQGNAVKGVIAEGLVRIYYLDQSGTEIDIGHTRTDADGNFALNLPEPDDGQMLMVEVRADADTRMRCDRTMGCESAQGFFDFAEAMPLPSHFKLMGVVDAATGHAFVSPLSHLIIQAAQQDSAMLTQTALKQASTQVMRAFELEQNPLLTRTPDLTTLTLDSRLSSGQFKQAMISAALFHQSLSPAWSRDFVALTSLDMAQVVLDTSLIALQLQREAASNQAPYTQILSRIHKMTSSHHQALTRPIVRQPQSETGNQSVTDDDMASAEFQSSAVIDYSGTLMITEQPEDQVVMPGSTVTFSVGVSGTGPFTYQWRLNGSTLIAGANGPTLTMPNIGLAYNYAYFDVRISNASNPRGIHSSMARLYISSASALPAFIETHPTAQNLTAGQSLLLQVRAGGDTPIYYQWLKNNIPIDGATSSRLSIPSVTLSDAGSYSVQVYNHGNTVPARSQSASVTVRASSVPLSITDQPENQFSSPGGSVTFAVAVSGTGPFTYQWRRNGSTLIPGANGSSLTLSNLTLADNNSYFDVLVSSATNPNGIRSTSARLNINTSTSTLPAQIVTHPSGQTISAGQPLRLQVSATGDAPIYYQWLKNNTPIVGATSASFSKEQVTSDDAGSYSVQVHNAGNSTPLRSNAADVAVVSVQSPLTITTQPEDQVATPGSTVTFSVGVSGTGPFTYQWRLNGSTPIAGANGPVLTMPSIGQAYNYAYFDVLVSNPANPRGVRSDMVRLYISSAMPLPAFIETQPVAQNLNVGQPLLLQVRASGDTPIVYQWLKNNTPIAGGTSASFSIASVSLSDAGSYSVQVSNLGNSVPARSQSVTVRVTDPNAQLSITRQPQDVVVTNGGSASFSVAVTGGTDMTYQWYRNACNPQYGSLIANSNRSTLTLYDIDASDAGSYCARITSANQATIDSSLARLTVLNDGTVPITILTQPLGQTVFAGAPITLSVLVSGSNLTYQWFKDSNPTPVYTGGSIYRIASAQAEHAGSYRVTVRNTDSSMATSNTAMVQVQTPQAALLNWNRPTTRVDRSALDADEIHGYVVQYGFSANSFAHEVRINGGNTLSHELQPLPRGPVYIRIATIDSHRQQGPFSAPITITIP